MSFILLVTRLIIYTLYLLPTQSHNHRIDRLDKPSQLCRFQYLPIQLLHYMLSIYFPLYSQF